MKRIGFVGLGNMGMGMALNLVKAGYQVTGLDLVKEKEKFFESHGGRIAGSNKEAGENSDVVFVMVLNDRQARSVIFGENGLIEGMEKGSVIILTASIGQAGSAALGQDLEKYGIHFVDAAVSGGKKGADEGTLTIMESASEAILDACEEVMQVIGKRIIRCGEHAGDAQVIKSCLQAVTAVEFNVINEVMVLAAKAGASPAVLAEVINFSAPGSAVTKLATGKILEREFEGGGSEIITLHKDMGILMNLSREHNVPMPLSALSAVCFQAGQAKLPGQDDWAMIKLLEDIVEAEVRQDRP